MEASGRPDAAPPRLHVQRGRPPLEIATHGVVNAKKTPSGQWVARTNVRGLDGRVRQMQRQGETKKAAIQNLEAAVEAIPGFHEDRVAEAQRRLPAGRRLHESKPRQHVVYRFYDASDRLLYVGISLSGIQRLGNHQAMKPWWPDVARTAFEHHPDRESAREAERLAIQQEQPLYNVAP